VYPMIMLTLVPFVLFGAVMALSSWEQRMLPPPEHTGATGPEQPVSADPELPKASGRSARIPPHPGPQEPSPVTARNVDHDFSNRSRPVRRGAGRLDHGHPATRHDRTPDHPDPRRRPPGRARDTQRRPR